MRISDWSSDVCSSDLSNVTPFSRTTGNPAKSDGSRNDPNTVLHSTPSAAANPRTKLDLPIPGPEINNDGTPARPFASNTVTAVAKSAIRKTQKNRHDGQSRTQQDTSNYTA